MRRQRRWRWTLAAAVLGALLVPSAAHAKVRCRSGVTIYQDARLRVFGVHFVDRNDPEGPFIGYDEYACLRGSRRPTGIGTTGSDAGVNSEDVPEIAFDGLRHLALVDVSDSEGGPDSLYESMDLKTGRRLHFVPGGCCADTDNNIPGPVRVMADGSLVRDEEDVILYAGGHGRTLSSPGTEATDLALNGTTLYWTEHTGTAPATAHSVTLPGPARAGENVVLGPVEVSAKPDCARRGSTTLLRTARLQVYTRHAHRRACRIGHRGSFAFDAGTHRTARILRTAGTRWVLAVDTYPSASGTHDVLQVADMRRGRVVTTVDAPAIAQATLLANGTAAWIETGGRLLSQAPRAAGPTVLADAADTLAGGRATIYWTSGGAPHSR